jgi:hypothetical protein
LHRHPKRVLRLPSMPSCAPGDQSSELMARFLVNGSPLRRIVRRLHPVDVDACPQRRTPLQDVPTHPVGLGHTTATPHCQSPFDLAAQRGHRGPQRRAFQGAFTHPMPPYNHLACLRQQGVTPLPCAAPTAAHRCKVPSQGRPTELPPPHRIPVGGPLTLGHQDAGKRLPPQLAGHVATARQPPHTPGHPAGHCDPSPGLLAPLTPTGRIEVGHRLLVHGSAGFLHWRGDRLWRRLLPLADRPSTPRDTTHIVPHLLWRAFGQALGPRTPRSPRLHPRTIGATGNPYWPGRSGHLAACRAPQLMPLLRGHHRRDRRHLNPWMTPRRGICSREGRVAVRALRGLASHARIDCFSRDQGARMARMARLTTATARASRTMRTLRRSRIARRRT